MNQERITFTTADNVTLVADWSHPEGAKRAVLLLHMMPATRISWLPLSRALNDAGIASLAIDLRGHGESVKKLDYKKFSDAEHQSSRLDVDAAINFLKTKGFDEPAIGVAGASIGANLTIDAMARYSGIGRGVALSPGLDYRGVKTDAPLRQLGGAQKLWIVAAEDDAYSADSARQLAGMRPEGTTLTIYKGSEHGTNLFAPQKTLIPEMVDFLRS